MAWKRDKQKELWTQLQRHSINRSTTYGVKPKVFIILNRLSLHGKCKHLHVVSDRAFSSTFTTLSLFPLLLP